MRETSSFSFFFSSSIISVFKEKLGGGDLHLRKHFIIISVSILKNYSSPVKNF